MTFTCSGSSLLIITVSKISVCCEPAFRSLKQDTAGRNQSPHREETFPTNDEGEEATPESGHALSVSTIGLIDKVQQSDSWQIVSCKPCNETSCGHGGKNTSTVWVYPS